MHMKKQFDWRRFKREKIAVHCKTEEEARDFCKKMHEQGMKWSDGCSYLEYTNYNNYKDKTYYLGNGCFCSYEYCKREEYTILEWSDYMQKEFTKSDLKDGMVVEEQRGVMGVVLKDRILYEDSWDSLISWEEDLRSNSCDGFDIVKIYKIRIESIYELSDILDIENLELIWERDETKRMTSEEMRVKLEELTGEKIEIEPSREERIGACYEYCKNMQFCKGCVIAEMRSDNGAQFVNYCDERLKECYEKVIANGKKDAYVAEKSYQRVEWSALSAKKSRTSG